jgi:hypothetical protein
MGGGHGPPKVVSILGVEDRVDGVIPGHVHQRKDACGIDQGRAFGRRHLFGYAVHRVARNVDDEQRDVGLVRGAGGAVGRAETFNLVEVGGLLRAR